MKGCLSIVCCQGRISIVDLQQKSDVASMPGSNGAYERCVTRVVPVVDVKTVLIDKFSQWLVSPPSRDEVRECASMRADSIFFDVW